MSEVEFDLLLDAVRTAIAPVPEEDFLPRQLTFNALPRAVTRIAISPDGELYRVPFDALRLADDHFAVERFEISLLSSAG